MLNTDRFRHVCRRRLITLNWLSLLASRQRATRAAGRVPLAACHAQATTRSKTTQHIIYDTRSLQHRRAFLCIDRVNCKRFYSLYCWEICTSLDLVKLTLKKNSDSVCLKEWQFFQCSLMMVLWLQSLGRTAIFLDIIWSKPRMMEITEIFSVFHRASEHWRAILI